MTSLSIITINYNDARGLQRTLDSIHSQNVPSLDVIVIDGGSTDESVEVIKQFRGLITSLVSEKDEGIYNAQNKGASKATGDFLLFMNSGDWFDHDRVLQLVLPQLDDQNSMYYGD